MERPEVLEWINQTLKAVNDDNGIKIDNNLLIFIRNYIHYNSGKLVDMNNIMYSIQIHQIGFINILGYMINNLINTFNIGILKDKNGNFIKLV